MYILNAEKINDKLRCKKHTYEYLMQKGCSLLSRDDYWYYFADTDEVRECLLHTPFIVKMRDALEFKRKEG